MHHVKSLIHSLRVAKVSKQGGGDKTLQLLRRFSNNEKINAMSSATVQQPPDDEDEAINMMDETIFYGESVEERIKRRFSESSTNRNMDSENPFYVGDLGEIHRQHMKWKSLLPRIEPFYAVKCNPDPLAVKYLASLGVGFDCASKTEMEQALYSGADASRIIYAQPTKQLSFLKYAHQNNISLMTFDSQEELLKIKNSYPEAKLVLRILVDDTHSAIPLGRKYGAPIQTVESLLHIAKNLKLNVVGVSFHVGSGCTHANAFYHAIARARDVFDQAKSIGFSFDLLDVGGGFNESTITSDKGATFEDVAKVLGPTVDEMFPSNNVRVIAEPGRYYVGGPAYTLCVGIVGRRTIEEGQTRKYMYYLNDGFYGSFLMPTLDKIKLNPKVLRKDGKYYYDHVLKDEKTYPCTIWGPTGCSLDCVIKDGKLPELNAGDWLYFEKFGAYSVTAATTFNGFEKPDMIHVNSFKE